MSLQENKQSFKETINSEVSEFVEKLEKIFDDHERQFQFNRTQVLETVLNCVGPFEEDLMDNEALSNFLQQTLNNDTEKRLKKKYLTKQMTQVSGSTKIFGNHDSFLMSHSNVHDSHLSPKSALSSETPLHRSDVKKQHMSDNASSKSDSGSVFNSKSYSDTKKHYRLYPTCMKLKIIQYASNYGLKEACQKYRVSGSKINIWGRSFSKTKKTRGRRPIDPEMEEKVCKWLKKQLENGTILTQKIIRDKAKQISISGQFKASKGWLEKFFKRRPELFEAYTQNRKLGNEFIFFDDDQLENANQMQVKMEQFGQIVQSTSSEFAVVKTLPEQK